jgi:hypothetical protein
MKASAAEAFAQSTAAEDAPPLYTGRAGSG